MDSSLITVTLLSMGMAGVLSIIVWRMLRDERHRSDARVAALASLAARPAETAVPVATIPPRPQTDDLPLNLGPARRTAASPSLFTEPERQSAWPRRIGVIACLALVVASVVLFSLAAGNRARAARSRIAAQPAHLDLLSLRDTRASGALTITGLVENPPDSSRLDRVTVTAYTFDGKGEFLASGRALLDVTALAPGDDSSFVVTVPAADATTRYRITFRAEDGAVISHVDRRQQTAVAAAW